MSLAVCLLPPSIRLSAFLVATTPHIRRPACRATQDQVNDDFFRQNKHVRTLYTPQTTYHITHSRYNAAAVTTSVQPTRSGYLLAAQGNVQEERGRLQAEFSSKEQVGHAAPGCLIALLQEVWDTTRDQGS